jgi:tetratricopeptide (TPR) repeat protein
VLRISAVVLVLAAVSLTSGCGGQDGSGSAADEARLLRRSGNYVQALMLFEEAVAMGDSQPLLLLDYAETAVLAAQSERSTQYRQKAREAVELLSSNPGDVDPREIGELWRRLAWEMARNADSLQAFNCLDRALEFNIQDIFESEWLFRGTFAGNHLELLARIPDSIAGSTTADSILTSSAERYLVELDRIPRSRTDLRESILRAKSSLLPYTGRRDDELAVLTELDRLGGIEPDMRLRRIDLLLEAAGRDIAEDRRTMARQKLLEVWDSNFSGEKIEAAYMLGLMEEEGGNIDDALMWYRRACSVSPGSSSQAALAAAARRDSLTYDHPEDGVHYPNEP